VASVPDLIRTFIAVDLSDDVKRQLDAIQDLLRSRLARAGIDRGVRWTQPDGIHLTFKFLGDTPADQLPEISQHLETALAGVGAPGLALAGLGVFPDPRAPRVLWVGLDGDTPALLALQRRVEAAISPLGFPAEARPFSPHLTLARVAEYVGRDERGRIGAAVQTTRLAEGAPFIAGTLSVIRSDLLPGGAVYTPLHTVSLRRRSQPDQQEDA
jgi:2'-5' RNA ligase